MSVRILVPQPKNYRGLGVTAYPLFLILVANFFKVGNKLLIADEESDQESRMGYKKKLNLDPPVLTPV
jgi:hypothetical protein